MAEGTDVFFLLDRTGSMQAVKADTIKAFNSYLDGLADADIRLTLAQFDSVSYDVVQNRVQAKDALRLNEENYKPRGWTPLIDSAHRLISDAKAALGETKGRVIVAIQTDGDENASRLNNWTQLNELIREQTAAGWEFVFLGCGLDAYKQGQKLGIDVSRTVAYAVGNSAEAFSSLTRNTREYAAGQRGAMGMSFTGSQKLDAGDVYDPLLKAAEEAKKKKKEDQDKA